MHEQTIIRRRGRPKKEETSNVIPAPAQEALACHEEQAQQPAMDTTTAKVLAKTVQLGLGVDLLGSKLSLNASRGAELQVTPLGIKAISGKNGRIVLIPWANIKAVELYQK